MVYQFTNHQQLVHRKQVGNVYEDMEQDLFEIQLNQHLMHLQNEVKRLLMKQFGQLNDLNYDMLDVQHLNYDDRYRK
jgi:hypothetical protein